MKSLRFIVILFILLVFSVIAFSVGQLFSASNLRDINQISAQLSADYQYFIDDKKSFYLRDVIEKPDLFSNKKPLNEQTPFELGGQVYWVKITVNNFSHQAFDLVVHVDNPMLAKFAGYQLGAAPLDLINQDYLSQSLPFNTASSSDVLTANSTPLAKAMATIFPHISINARAKQQQQILLRIEPTGPPSVALVVYQKKDFEQLQLLTSLLFSAFVCVILLMVLYNLVLYATLKDKLYLVYISYLLSAFIVSASVNGFGYLFFAPETQDWLNQHSLFFHYYLVIFLVLFTLFFLRYDHVKNKIYTVGMTLAGLLVVASFASLLMPHEQQVSVFFTIQPICYLFAIVLVMLRLSKDFAWARFYFLSWIPFFLGGSIQPLMLLNQIEYSFYTRHAFLLGVFVEIIFMAFALAERMRRYDQDRLTEVSFDANTGIGRKILLEKTIDKRLKSQTADIAVMVIKPEHIERVALYLESNNTKGLFQQFHQRLVSLFVHNDAIIYLTNRKEKICSIDDNHLAILIDQDKNSQDISVLVHSIQQMIAEAYYVENMQLPLSCAIGIAVYPAHGKNPEELIHSAKMAAEQAIISRNKWCYFEASQSEKGSYPLKLAADLKQAIELGNFKLFHHPQIDLKTMRVCGSECLLRWEHPQEGFISPDVFIAIAEDTGLINQLTQWVIHKAIEQHMVIMENGYKHHVVSINISGMDIVNENFFDYLCTEIENVGLATNKVVLELKESSKIMRSADAIKMVNQLHELGITVSVDDFGAGDTSMAYISDFPCQEIKVDRHLVENIRDNQKRTIITKTAVTMAKSLGLEVVAEGINNENDEAMLRKFGCDIGQGFYYAKPMSLPEYLIWLENEVNGRQPEHEGVLLPKEK